MKELIEKISNECYLIGYLIGYKNGIEVSKKASIDFIETFENNMIEKIKYDVEKAKEKVPEEILSLINIFYEGE